MPKSSIFCLIDVSGSMEGAYSRDFSNSKIGSLMGTFNNIVYSENLLGSEMDIFFFSLIFGTIKFNKWLNVLAIFDFLLKYGNLNIDIDKIIYDKEYFYINPEKKILQLLSDEGAIDLDRYIHQIEKKYLNIIAYYLDRDKV